MQTNNKMKCGGLEDVVAEFQLPPEAGIRLADPTLVSYYKDYKARTLWLDKDIDDSLYTEIRSILQWNRDDEKAGLAPEDRKPIILLIHSYGGNLDSCFALLDVMQLSKTPIYTVNMNVAMSAGCLIFLNGHKRFCMPKSQALIHSGSGGQQGTYEQVMAQTENYKKLVNMMRDNILEHTKIDAKTFTKWKGKETYLYADEQIQWGLADEIVDDLSKIL